MSQPITVVVGVITFMVGYVVTGEVYGSAALGALAVVAMFAMSGIGDEY